MKGFLLIFLVTFCVLGLKAQSIGNAQDLAAFNAVASSGGGGGSPIIIKQITHVYPGTAATLTVTAGNMLVMNMSGGLMATPSTISDSLGSSWNLTVRSNVLLNLTHNITLGVWWTIAGSSGSDTVTIANAPADSGVTLMELSGPMTTLEASNIVFAASNSSTATGVAITSSGTTNAVFSLYGDEASAYPTSVNAPFSFDSRVPPDTSHYDALGVYTNAPAGSSTAVFNLQTTTASWGVATYTIK